MPKLTKNYVRIDSPTLIIEKPPLKTLKFFCEIPNMSISLYFDLDYLRL